MGASLGLNRTAYRREVDAAVVDFSGKIIQLADHVAQKGLGSGIGCSHDPVELHHSSLAALNEGLAGLSASVEAAVDAVRGLALTHSRRPLRQAVSLDHNRALRAYLVERSLA